MNAQRKPGEPISDARLQQLIDEFSRRYVRERVKDSANYDTVSALSELKGVRAGLKRGAA